MNEDADKVTQLRRETASNCPYAVSAGQPLWLFTY